MRVTRYTRHSPTNDKGNGGPGSQSLGVKLVTILLKRRPGRKRHAIGLRFTETIVEIHLLPKIDVYRLRRRRLSYPGEPL